MATRTIFFGSSPYSLIILAKLLSLPDFELTAVVTKADKATGRDQIVTPNAVAAFAQTHHLPLYQPTEFDTKFKLDISHLSLDIGLCVAYGPPFFDQEMIDIPQNKIVNIHPSPLPRYRGATPGPWQIINGETTSAVTFFQIDALPDHGPIIAQIPFPISPTETAATFYTKAFNLAADNLDSILKSYLKNPTSLLTQDHSQKSYFPKFTKESAKIDWSWPSAKIDRFIRAMLPWPVAWTEVKNSSGTILKMKILSSSFPATGWSASGRDFQPDSVQIEGKKITPWAQIAQYYQIIK